MAPHILRVPTEIRLKILQYAFWHEPRYISIDKDSSATVSAVLLACSLLHGEALTIARESTFKLYEPAASYQIRREDERDVVEEVVQKVVQEVLPKFAKKAVKTLEFDLALVHNISAEEFSSLSLNSANDMQHIFQFKGHGQWSQIQSVFSVTTPQLTNARESIPDGLDSVLYLPATYTFSSVAETMLQYYEPSVLRCKVDSIGEWTSMPAPHPVMRDYVLAPIAVLFTALFSINPRTEVLDVICADNTARKKLEACWQMDDSTGDEFYQLLRELMDGEQSPLNYPQYTIQPGFEPPKPSPAQLEDWKAWIGKYRWQFSGYENSKIIAGNRGSSSFFFS